MGKDVMLAISGGEVRGASLIQDGDIIETWEAQEPLLGKTRELLGLTQINPLRAQTVRVYHKPNEHPMLHIGCVILQQNASQLQRGASHAEAKDHQ